MGFDFVNTRLYGATGPFTITSGSTTYSVMNANIGNLLQLTPLNASASLSGTLFVRNGLIMSASNLTASNQSF